MGKSTISMAIFNSKLFVYQRVVGISVDSPHETKHFLREVHLDPPPKEMVKHVLNISGKTPSLWLPNGGI